MYHVSLNKEECSGCSACASICPKQCISMVSDKEGFFYPVINKNQCISCGRCEQVCPFNLKNADGDFIKCYYGWMLDDFERYKSTSGGAFYEIARVAFNMGITHVYGAAFDDDQTVRHIHVENFNDIDRLRRSKYVQSNIGYVFLEIRGFLQKGIKVLFSGTPCQVQGLLNLIPEKNKINLYTIALVCHGVSSPTVFERYLNEISKKYSGRVSSITFRDKQVVNDRLSHKCTTIAFEDGRKIISVDNPYTLAFGIGLITRQSCFNCPFSTPYRNADITIGDFWGIEKIYSEYAKSISKGISLIITHTKKGENLIKNVGVSFELGDADLSWAINPSQPQLIHPIKKYPRRDSFMKAIAKGREFSKRARFEILLYKVRQSVCFRFKKIMKMISKERKNYE